MRLFYRYTFFCNLFFITQNFASEEKHFRQLKPFFPRTEQYNISLRILDYYLSGLVSPDWVDPKYYYYLVEVHNLEMFLQSTNAFFRKMLKNPILSLKDCNVSLVPIRVKSKNYQGCPDKPFYILPSEEQLISVLACRGYTKSEMRDLAWQKYNSDQLMWKLLIMHQNEPFNTYIPGQKTIFELIDDVFKLSQPCTIT